MARSNFIVTLAIAALVLSAPTHGQKYCGIALGTGHDLRGYRQAKTNIVLSHMKRDGATYVQISTYLKQVGRNGVKGIPVTGDGVLRIVLRKAKRRGLKTFLKPVVEPETPKGKFIWRGFIPGTKRWFDDVHTPWILRMATLAQQEKVDILSIGSEYVGTLGNNAAWLDTIRLVRQVYKGKLTYIANHDSYKRVKFFKKLDFISISAYFRLRQTRRGPYPDAAGLSKLYQRKANELLAWRRRAKLGGKKILIAEWGMQSKGNGVGYYVPWDWKARGPLSLDEQLKFYDAFFATFVNKPWSLGVMVWHYELEPFAGKSGPTKVGYTPQNKPALQTMKKYFNRLC